MKRIFDILVFLSWWWGSHINPCRWLLSFFSGSFGTSGCCRFFGTCYHKWCTGSTRENCDGMRTRFGVTKGIIGESNDIDDVGHGATGPSVAFPIVIVTDRKEHKEFNKAFNGVEKGKEKWIRRIRIQIVKQEITTYAMLHWSQLPPCMSHLIHSSDEIHQQTIHILPW